MRFLLWLCVIVLFSVQGFHSPLSLKQIPTIRSIARIKMNQIKLKMSTHQPQYDIGPPPDLPSLLLANRIIYLGMSIVPSVTELVIAQLLHLNNEGDAPITLYINSPGTNSPDGKPLSYDTEAFAIADTMQFIAPPIHTICIGQAHGTAAMLLSLGAKGHRAALPNASIMLHQPKSRSRGSSIDISIKAKEINANRKTVNEFLSLTCEKDLATIEQDTARMKYLSAEEAVAYGLIDKVLHQEEGRAMNFMNYLQ